MLVLHRRASALLVSIFLLLSLIVSGPASLLSHAGASASVADVASGFLLYKFPTPQPLCNGVGLNTAPSNAFARDECGFGIFTLTGAHEAADIKVEFISDSGTKFLEVPVTLDTDNADSDDWQFEILPDGTWPAGEITARVVVAGQGNVGEAVFRHNYLSASVVVAPGDYSPGTPISVTGELDQFNILGAGTEEETPVAGSYKVLLVGANGSELYRSGVLTANAGGVDGAIAATIPGSATSGVTAGPDTNFTTTLSVEVVETSYTDPSTGLWGSRRAGSAPVDVTVTPASLQIENNFVSATGWVKPGDSYPFRVTVSNNTASAAANAEVTLSPVDGTTFTVVKTIGSAGSASITSGTIDWNIGTVPVGQTKTLIVEAVADTAGQDAQIVWKDLSSEASLTYDGLGSPLTSESHGPKVIPQDQNFDTARYGDRPFPVVPVDYFDRSHEAGHSGETLANKINNPSVAGSTFNLYQEMSFGQLYPHGTVPSAGIATADFSNFDAAGFTAIEPAGTCHGATFKEAVDTPLYSERIRDGWYQLPGNTDYYGDDRYGSALAGSVGGVGAIAQIDDACGPTGKAVYDAALIADPEIDYNDYDTDKDGVVDFFMMVFAGLGGNGDSQLNGVPPYDNIWPHSSSLEFYYTSVEGDGYVSDDQLKNLEGENLWWTDASRTEQTTTASSGLPVFVRVGPYNVNPESAIDHASVISHEYGHSLGLPDFYSTGGRETYGDWTLMATDKSQNMDVFSKQELGWIVPKVLEPGQTTTVSGWEDSKKDIHEITWQTGDEEPYTLSGEDVHNGEAYVAKLKPRAVIDPQKVADGASSDHIWWSESGNDFGCSPQSGHNFDVYLPELADLAATDTVTLKFKSYWDIEWDFDYGFVLYSHPGVAGEEDQYTSMPSANGYTTAATTNPNQNACQSKYDNGLTGTSASYAAGTQEADRLLGNYDDGGFVEDAYDLSGAIGEATSLRFSYSTDPGLSRPGWFIDDVEVIVNEGVAGEEVIYTSNFEDGADEDRIYNGGCQEDLSIAARCTKGWSYISALEGSPADHAYYLEMRDRSGFDLDGRGENDRDPIGFAPGLLLTYTDEAHGYGNAGTDDPPAQSPLDSQPEIGNSAPNLNDAAYTSAAGDKSFSDFGAGHTDNYADPSSADGNWLFAYDCLSFDVLSMSGTDNGPENAPYDLTGDVQFTMGTGCGEFDYGFEGSGEEPPPPPPVDPKCSVVGTAGDDVLKGSNKNEYFCGLGGDDIIIGKGGKDTVLAGSGNDVVRGGPGRDIIKGGRGNDKLNGGRARDKVLGGYGRDTIRGGDRADVLEGGNQPDTLYGGNGNDMLRGGNGNDRCLGGRGRDRRESC